MKKPIQLLIVLGFMACAQGAPMDYFGNDIFYKGDVMIDFENRTYNAGEDLLANISMINMEEFPLVDGYAVIEVVKGGQEHVYPSQQSDADNVLYEEIIRGMNLAPLAKETLKYSFKIPSDLATGTYRLEVYFLTPRTPVVGLAHILMSPQYIVFQVQGSGNFPYANIVRTKTYFGNMSGPIGTQASTASTMTSIVYVQSSSNAALSGLLLNLTVCEWDDTACSPDTLFYTKQYSVPVISPGASVKVDAAFSVPELPEAYAVRMELTDKVGRTISLYRSRIIVSGETARIRKLIMDKMHYNEKENGQIKLLIGPSPDHYTLPIVKNAKVTVSIDEKGRSLFSQTETIPEISAEAGFLYRIYNFSAPKELSEFEVCGRIDSESGKNFDKFCFNVTPAKIETVKSRLAVRYDYNYKTEALEVNLCGEDAVSGIALNVKASVLLSTANLKTVIANVDNVVASPCSKVSLPVKSGSYLLLVTDLSTGEQLRYDVKVVPNEQQAAASCGNSQCETGEDSVTCCADCGCSGSMQCVKDACVEAAKPAVCGNAKCEAGENSASCCADCGCQQGKECSNNACKDKENPLSIYSLVLVLIVIIILALFMYKKPKNNKGSKK